MIVNTSMSIPRYSRHSGLLTELLVHVANRTSKLKDGDNDANSTAEMRGADRKRSHRRNRCFTVHDYTKTNLALTWTCPQQENGFAVSRPCMTGDPDEEGEDSGFLKDVEVECIDDAIPLREDKTHVDHFIRVPCERKI